MRRFALLTAALGLLAWLAAPALSARPYVPTAVDFEQSIGARGGAAAAGGTWRSGVIEAPRRFDMVGFRWRGRGELQPRIRVRDAAGRWHAWTRMGDNHGGRPGSEPVWAGGADAYELRMRRRPSSLRAHFVNVSGTASGADRVKTGVRKVAHAAFVALTGTPAQAQAQGSGPPGIVSRAGWGGEQCKPRAKASYGTVQAGFVHHTVSANGYGPEDGPGIVLSICRYHRNANGWNDVGYNFLVDRYGKIYEGRAGGIDQAVVGAQAQGYNASSTGVANIGTFAGAPQTPAGIAATADLLAWKLSVHGAPTEGTVQVESAGGPTNRFPKGAPVTLPRIAGHRDGDSTECPGGVLFAQLPEIRRRAAERAPAYRQAASGGLELRLERPRVTYPDPARVTGRLTQPDGSPLGGQPVAVQARSGTRFRTLQQATTDGDGRFSAVVGTSWSRALRASTVVPGGGRVTSPVRPVEVTPVVQARLSARRVAERSRLVVSGRSRPHKSGLVVEVARRTSAGGYRVVARIAGRARSGRFRILVRPRRPALTRIRVITRADSRNRAGASPPVYTRVVSRRSAASGGTGPG